MKKIIIVSVIALLILGIGIFVGIHLSKPEQSDNEKQSQEVSTEDQEEVAASFLKMYYTTNYNDRYLTIIDNQGEIKDSADFEKRASDFYKEFKKITTSDYYLKMIADRAVYKSDKLNYENGEPISVDTVKLEVCDNSLTPKYKYLVNASKEAYNGKLALTITGFIYLDTSSDVPLVAELKGEEVNEEQTTEATEIDTVEPEKTNEVINETKPPETEAPTDPPDPEQKEKETEEPESEPEHSEPEVQQPEYNDEPAAPAQQEQHYMPNLTVPETNKGIYDNNINYAAFNLINNYRSEHGLSPLSWASNLEAPAKIRAQEISESFGKTRPNGQPWYSVCEDLMYGENISYGYFTADDVCNSWFNNSNHRNNILGDYTTTYIACFLTSDGNCYWVQEFGY